MPGIILHIDSDKNYLEKCLNYYKKHKLKCYSYIYNENEYPHVIEKLIKKHNPDIVVITGHDGMIKSGTDYNNINNYRNSRYFIKAVLNARKWRESGNDLVIFAGACQSYFEAIMNAGANFASSPRKNFD